MSELWIVADTHWCRYIMARRKLRTVNSETRRSPIFVCLVTNDVLAARYMQCILGDRRFKVFVDRNSVTYRRALKSRSGIMLIDRDSIKEPLENYLQSIRVQFPEAKILVTGSGYSNNALCRLLFLGIRGFVPYSSIASLRRAVQSVVEGQIWAPRKVIAQFPRYVAELSQSRQRLFTARELSVLDLLKGRLSTKEMGQALGISSRTVKFHLQNIFSKLGVHDRYSARDLLRLNESLASGS